MTKKITAAVLLSLSLHSASFAQALQKSNVHVGFVYPISSNGTHAAEYTNTCSFHLISGVSYSEQAFCASGIASIIKDSAAGFTGSGIANIIGNSATGVQAAGFINYTTNHTKGLQAAGFINLSGSVQGAQTAGFANVASKNVNGLQAAGFINTAKNATTQAAGFMNLCDSTYVQAAGFINIARQVKGTQVAGFMNLCDSTRVQAAGFTNIARHVKGAQIVGFANVAQDVDGVQVAGFINVAHKVKGAQIAGFINIADSSDYPIGIINLIKNGEKHIGVMADETGTTYATFRSGGHVLYGIVGVGYNGSNQRSIYAMQAGMGVHWSLSRMFVLNGEATATSLTDFRRNNDMQAGIKLLPTLRIRSLELYAGPSINYAISAGHSPFSRSNIWSENYYGYVNELYIGFQGGVQFHF